MNDLLKVMQDRCEFQIANTSLVNPSFTLAGLYTASGSHSQLNGSYRDTEPGVHGKEMTVQKRQGGDTNRHLNYKTKTELKLKLPY